MVADVTEPSPFVTAVVVALAGVRDGQEVAVLGAGTVLRKALSAGCQRELTETGPVDVAVALAAFDVPGAVALLKPGGRLVAIAADRGAVERTATLHGLVLRHVEPVLGRVAWSGNLPHEQPT